jgi:hypothetical protein
LEVDYVGKTCLRRGGLGHYARECPTPKGNGKGGGKIGKGYGKDGGYKGYKGFGKESSGYGYKGYNGYGKDGGNKGDKGGKGGKGVSGPCFVFGEMGHRAASCPNRKGGVKCTSVRWTARERQPWRESGGSLLCRRSRSGTR